MTKLHAWTESSIIVEFMVKLIWEHNLSVGSYGTFKMPPGSLDFWCSTGKKWDPPTPPCTVPFKSKSTLNSRSSRETRIENRVENRDSILDCCVSILDSCETHQTGTAFVYFRVIRSLLSILDCCEILQVTTFVQVLSNLLTSLTLEKSLYSIK